MDSRPSSPLRVYDYLNATFYLQDYYQFRKSSSPQFSYESWAVEVDLKSRSFLRLMVAGKKKISQRFIDAFSRLNFATKNEEIYFQYLVKYSQASSGADRQLYSSQMIKIIKHESSAQIISEKNDFISDPLLPRLLSLLCFSDLRATSEICARLFKISLSQAQEALLKLEQMNLAEKVQIGDQTVWLALSDTFHVPDDYGSFDLMKFHTKSLQEAIAAFELPKPLRRYKSLLVPMDEKSLENFNRALEGFISEQLLIYNSKNGAGAYLYQVNFNFHPVTQKIDLNRVTSERV